MRNAPTAHDLMMELESAYAMLESYKQAVHQLSFDLEMTKENPNTFANVAAIRKIALNQAADFVSDWGVPKSGEDFVKLCEQIRSLHETRALAVARGLAAIGIHYGDKP